MEARVQGRLRAALRRASSRVVHDWDTEPAQGANDSAAKQADLSLDSFTRRARAGVTRTLGRVARAHGPAPIAARFHFLLRGGAKIIAARPRPAQGREVTRGAK